MIFHMFEQFKMVALQLFIQEIPKLSIVIFFFRVV